MSRHDPVVWGEGMLLAPQHLQQWDRYVHHMVAERFRLSQGFEWGWTQLEIDREALRNGRFGVLAARGVLPDGTPIAAPDDDPLPAARLLEGQLDARQESLTAYLGLPASRPGRAEVGEQARPGEPAPRMVPAVFEMPDSNTGTDPRPVTTARRNLVLLFPGEALGDHDALPVAEVVRTSDGGYALRETFVPPLLSIGASSIMVDWVRTQLERLIAKSTEYSARRRQRGSHADFAVSDAVAFWMLRTVNTWIPVVSHFVRHRRAHPEQVYLVLGQLAGELCTFSADLHPKELPAYDHRALGPTFSGLMDVLSRLLEITQESKAVRIDLEKKDGSIYLGRIQDPRLLEPSASLFLGARAEIEEQRLVAELPAKVKIASLDKIDFLIANALRGVPVNYAHVTPAGLPVKTNFVYFQLDSNCDVWEGIKGSKNLAIFTPPDVPGLTLELLGLRE